MYYYRAQVLLLKLGSVEFFLLLASCSSPLRFLLASFSFAFAFGIFLEQGGGFAFAFGIFLGQGGGSGWRARSRRRAVAVVPLPVLQPVQLLARLRSSHCTS